MIMSNSFLVVGLGNIGAEYANTRHNMGFMVLDAWAQASNAVFETGRYASTAEVSFKGRKFILIKPSTYMNLSGNAVRYWINEKKIRPENLLVVVDDLSLPFGKIRIKPSGSEGGHNGLKSITSVLGTQEYARLRFGIGNDFPRGGQVNWVLGEFPPEQLEHLNERINIACEAIKSFCLAGMQFTMNNFNNK